MRFMKSSLTMLPPSLTPYTRHHDKNTNKNSEVRIIVKGKNKKSRRQK
jgi:hypothetical protein